MTNIRFKNLLFRIFPKIKLKFLCWNKKTFIYIVKEKYIAKLGINKFFKIS